MRVQAKININKSVLLFSVFGDVCIPAVVLSFINTVLTLHPFLLLCSK